jgi:putative acetyltransferase
VYGGKGKGQGEMDLQTIVSEVYVEDFPRVVEVWEASVRATHHFVSETDIEYFRPLVRDELPSVELACVRDTDGLVAGFMGVAKGKIEMLFVHPNWRGCRIGKRLIRYAVDMLGATTLEVNEQNAQALGFYLHMGFEVAGRSELDWSGKPYPTLHMRLAAAN